MPMRLPTCRMVERTPEALPTRSLGAVAITAEVTGATARPMPMPEIANGTTRSAGDVSGEIFPIPGSRPAIQASPAASTNMPPATIHLLPRRSDSTPASGAAKMMTADIGAITNPALTAL